MIRALLLLVCVAGLAWSSARLAREAWAERAAPAFALYCLFLAYLAAFLVLLVTATMVEWDAGVAAARGIGWPFVRVGEAYHRALRDALPQSLVQIAVLASGLLVLALLGLIKRRLRPARTRRP